MQKDDGTMFQLPEDKEAEEKLLKELTGKLTEVDGEPWVIQVGEVVELKGARFRVKSVNPKKVILRSLPQKV